MIAQAEWKNSGTELESEDAIVAMNEHEALNGPLPASLVVLKGSLELIVKTSQYACRNLRDDHPHENYSLHRGEVTARGGSKSDILKSLDDLFKK